MIRSLLVLGFSALISFSLVGCSSNPPKEYDRDRAERNAEKSQQELKEYEKEAMKKNQ